MASAASAKSLRRRLQRQLEFYLSASNLRQDKFLRQHMDDDGFVPAALLLSFHKLRALQATERLLLEAAAKSDALRVDEAHAAIAPARAALQQALEGGGRAEADAHTIYVEGYDVDAHDHDSLRKVFAVFGKVNLVSMPRFSPSRKFKGFAFIEFATEDAAQQAVRAAQAVERDEALRGLRAMGKRQWLEMKEKLKTQLGGNPTKPKATVTDPKPSSQPAEESKQIKTSSVSGHVRFRDEDDDASEEEKPQDAKRPRRKSE